MCACLSGRGRESDSVRVYEWAFVCPYFLTPNVMQNKSPIADTSDFLSLLLRSVCVEAKQLGLTDGELDISVIK